VLAFGTQVRGFIYIYIYIYIYIERERERERERAVDWRNRDISVGIVWYESLNKGKRFFTSLKLLHLLCTSIILLCDRCRVSFPGAERPGLEFSQLPPSSAEGNNHWSYTSAPTPPVISWLGNRQVYRCTFTGEWILMEFSIAGSVTKICRHIPALVRI
jgi:hypothetical protein